MPVSIKDKAIALFQFVKGLNELKQKITKSVEDYLWYKPLNDLPFDPQNIKVNYRDRIENEDVGERNFLLSVHKPDFIKCPEPSRELIDWLKPGWDRYNNDVNVYDYLPKDEKKANDGFPVERFSDNSNRVNEFRNWLERRKKWSEHEKLTQKTQELFTELYHLFFELQRESETEEIVVANGFVRLSNNSEIDHPVLTRRVKLRFDPIKNTIFVEDLDVPTEFYSALFSDSDSVNKEAFAQVNTDLRTNDYHPFDRNDTSNYLKGLIRQLSPKSTFSDKGIPQDWSENNELLLYLNPCFIVRKRIDGTLKAIELILQNIEETGYVPQPIIDIINGKNDNNQDDSVEETSIEEKLAAVGGESPDILLSKAANKEQLEIVKRIEKHNAVLVQGPPGTGKTHTIANLLGHFLANGKSVLVTSHTSKALNVLKEKVNKEIQDLCVSVLDDSKADMERSIGNMMEYRSLHTFENVRREAQEIAEKRNAVIKSLADIRKTIYERIHQENKCIVFDGEEFSPIDAAKFVAENSNDCSYIPGNIKIGIPLPLTHEQFSILYESNVTLSIEEEKELLAKLPDPKNLLNPSEFEESIDALQSLNDGIAEISRKNYWQVSTNDNEIKIQYNLGSISLSYPDDAEIRNLKSYALSINDLEKWMIHAAVDGKTEQRKARWNTLINQIKQTCELGNRVVAEQFGHSIAFNGINDYSLLKIQFGNIKNNCFTKNGLRKVAFLFHKDWERTWNSVTIDGHPAQSMEECEWVIHFAELNEKWNLCARFWDELLSVHGVKQFFDLSQECPEQVSSNFIPSIERFIDWYQEEYKSVLDKLNQVGIESKFVFQTEVLDDEVKKTEKILTTIRHTIPMLCDMLSSITERAKVFGTLQQLRNQLTIDGIGKSEISCNLIRAVDMRDKESYKVHYEALCDVFPKNAILHKRKELLDILELSAPDWANAIRHREGIHGLPKAPENLHKAWKWKQISYTIDEILEKPYQQLISDSASLSKEYRTLTSKFAALQAWSHLLKRLNNNPELRSSLVAWTQTVRRIGRGTGRNVPTYRAEARKLMEKCQKAVPCWIMPIHRALESLNPKENRFDIVIVDEASQSDLSSLAVLYMGAKLIIVGDDEQVSPDATGISIERTKTLQTTIANIIPDSHLYDLNTSIYDIAKKIFTETMLCEHFRCVPEIINFSNMLSYENKIKPLRSSKDSVLLPAVVHYRVNGNRNSRKENKIEAQSIVALMKSCMKQSEYAGKTFGVISLLGDEQVKCIQRLIEKEIDAEDIISRRILCGNSANFQGDERDVVFLSMVDSNDSDTPLPLRVCDDAKKVYKKRYNVAASRAKDQLWVVTSLDAANDLKSGDLRKLLLDYAKNPSINELRNKQIEHDSESPFEEAVAKALSNRGYHIVQQWEVGTYRIDMVAMYQGKAIAIECDGEQWHSTESQIYSDMERQTILERIGWKFIRIRGSEYFLNPTKTIESVIEKLNNFGIEPESCEEISQEDRETELLHRIKQFADLPVTEEQNVDVETIAHALNDNEEIELLKSTESLESGKTVGEKKKEKEDSHDAKDAVPTEKRKKSQKEQIIDNDSSEQASEKKTKTKVEKKAVGYTLDLKFDNEDESPIVFTDVISFLKSNNVKYSDKRNNGGSLWLIGGRELKDIVYKIKVHFKIEFRYKEGGGRATKGENAWYSIN